MTRNLRRIDADLRADPEANRLFLDCILTGPGNREISRRLGIAERTVKAHLTNLMTKIKVTSRIEAALFAYSHHRRLADRL